MSFTRELRRAPAYAAALALILVAMAATLYWLAGAQRINYDSYWSLFIARQDLWQDRWREIADGPHPPLFYSAVRVAISWLGLNAVAYRFVSIASIVAGAWLLAAVVWRTTANLAFSTVAAAAFGFSFVSVAMAMEVRTYALVALFTLVAFSCYLAWWDATGSRQSTVAGIGFALALTLAILTDYSALFFAADAIIVTLVAVIVDAARRRQGLQVLSRRLTVAALLFVVPIAAAAVLYRVHVSHLAGQLGHVDQFTFAGPPDAAPVFLVRNTLNVARLLLPAWSGEPIDPTLGPIGGGVLAAARLVRIGLILVAAAGIVCLAGSGDHRLRRVAVIFAVLLGLNAAAGLAGGYPFGGRLRHEFFLLPFGLAAIMSLAEEVRRRVASRFNNQGVWASAVALGIFLNVISWATALRIFHGPMFQPQMDRFVALVGSPKTMLVDRFNFINVFSSYHGWQWAVVRQHDDPDLQVWQVTGPGGVMHVCRDRWQWQLDMSALQTYRNAKRCLDNTGSTRVGLFRAQAPGVTPQWDMATTEVLAERLSQQYDLKPTVLDVDGRHVYAELTIRDR